MDIAYFIQCIVTDCTEEELIIIFNFMVNEQALGDRDPRVRKVMLEAGLVAIRTRGEDNSAQLMPILEKYLASPNNTEAGDYVREAAVVFYGALAQFLNKTDPRIPQVIDRLVETLKTPSESVQLAVAECLPPLIKETSQIVPDLVKDLLQKLSESPKYAERKGAAFGLAGVVKGHGLASMKKFEIIDRLKVFIGDKKKVESRQGGMFAIEAFSMILGRQFEPYLVQIIPLLLQSFGDPKNEVRDATTEAARAIMSKISSHGVKLILSMILKGLDDRQWRTKQGAVELLGSMAFCAPKQLSVSLPKIIPNLVEVLTDSHEKVQLAGKNALVNFGEVIGNPEIHALVPVIMNALCDPNKQTQKALSSLQQTSFVHYIDAPSLALIFPILNRALKERSSLVKQKASQIVGNMTSLTNERDFLPYMPAILPAIKEVLVDTVPDTRATGKFHDC